MRRPNGFTLIELLITLIVLALLAAMAAPAFSRLIRDLRVETVTWSLLEATQTARSHAARANTRTTLAADPAWEEGWIIFIDSNHNAEHDEEETLVAEHSDIPEQVTIEGNRPVADYVSYLGTGESRWASGDRDSAFQAGTITVCPREEGPGFELVLARGGRVRKEELDKQECAEA